MAKTFTRIGKDIVMAVKSGGPDPDSNSRLRAIMQNAKSVNMPKDNIERAIKRAVSKDQADYKETIFEGYAPHGIAVLVETATDNKVQPVSDFDLVLNVEREHLNIDIGVIINTRGEIIGCHIAVSIYAHTAKEIERTPNQENFIVVAWIAVGDLDRIAPKCVETVLT